MVLGIDSSAVSAGCALYDGKKIIAEQFLNTRHTHSETLLPMIENMLKNAEVTLSDVKKIAVTNGPGSFTGLRISVSCVKGMAFGAKIPVVGVSTLEAIAHNFIGVDGIICACMDARLNQVYNALFISRNGNIIRICNDRAIKLSELSDELSDMLPHFDERLIFAGDGAELAYEFTERKYELAPLVLRYQRASGVCLAAEDKPEIDPAALMPSYLRLSQAEREKLGKNENQAVEKD